MSGLPDNVCNVLGKAMDLRLDRHHLLASNVANVDTPGFTPTDMKFAHLLKIQEQSTAPRRTSERHLSGLEAGSGQAELFFDPSSQPGLDGNSVSLDKEMAKIAENSIAYKAIANALQKKLALLRYAVSEGG